VTLEELLPHVALGGVYLCEDVHARFNRFAAYVHGIVDRLNCVHSGTPLPKPNEDSYYDVSPLQRHIHSIHFYPFVTVIEKHESEVERLVSSKRGTEWQPFL
jgi:hypothetical protein